MEKPYTNAEKRYFGYTTKIKRLFDNLILSYKNLYIINFIVKFA